MASKPSSSQLPAKHQYDRDNRHVYGFLERYGLADEGDACLFSGIG
jgi:xylose isomerase